MSSLSIKRGGGYPDWLRGYRIFLDGEEHGTVRHNSVRTFEVGSGRHEVQLRMDWSSSAVVAVDVDDADVTLACGPAVRSGWSIFSFSHPAGDTIWLGPKAPAAPATRA